MKTTLVNVKTTLEKELCQQLLQTEAELEDAQKKIAIAKRNILSTETLVIEKSVAIERLRAAILEIQDTTPSEEKSFNDIELDNFRKNNKDTMEFISAREKDRLK
jgi:hypothetical protein